MAVLIPTSHPCNLFQHFLRVELIGSRGIPRSFACYCDFVCYFAGEILATSKRSLSFIANFEILPRLRCTYFFDDTGSFLSFGRSTRTEKDPNCRWPGSWKFETARKLLRPSGKFCYREIASTMRCLQHVAAKFPAELFPNCTISLKLPREIRTSISLIRRNYHRETLCSSARSWKSFVRIDRRVTRGPIPLNRNGDVRICVMKV